MKSKNNIFQWMQDSEYRCGAPARLPAGVTGEEATRLWNTVMRPIYGPCQNLVKKKNTVTPSCALTLLVEEFLNDPEHIDLKFDCERPSDKDIYEAAGFSRAKWGRIKSGKLPDLERGNVFALAIALRLDAEQTEQLLFAAGFALNYDLDLDCAMMYFIHHEIYDMERIYRILSEFCNVKNGLDCFLFRPLEEKQKPDREHSRK